MLLVADKGWNRAGIEPLAGWLVTMAEYRRWLCFRCRDLLRRFVLLMPVPSPFLKSMGVGCSGSNFWRAQAEFERKWKITINGIMLWMLLRTNSKAEAWLGLTVWTEIRYRNVGEGDGAVHSAKRINNEGRKKKWEEWTFLGPVTLLSSFQSLTTATSLVLVRVYTVSFIYIQVLISTKIILGFLYSLIP